VPTVIGVSSNNNAMETDQPPNNNNKKYYIDTNSVYVARENTEIASFVKDSMSKLNHICTYPGNNIAIYYTNQVKHAL